MGFRFADLTHSDAISGARIFRYRTADPIETVVSDGYFGDVKELMCEGDTLEVSTSDDTTYSFPVVSPDVRLAPSAALH